MAPYKRRSAAATIMFDKILIYGGMDELDINKNDCLMYSVTQDHWVVLNDKIIGSVKSLSMHTCVAVLPGDTIVTKGWDFYNHPAILKLNNSDKIYYIGI